MQTLPVKTRLYAASLSAVAGFIDAVGFIYTGGYFVSFMSGNTTNFAVRLADWIEGVGISAAIILLFVAGVVAGTLLARRLDPARRTNLLFGIAGMIALAAILAMIGQPWPAIFILPFAMGALNTIFERNGEAPFGVTYMTGALVKAGQHIAAALAGGPRWNWIPYTLLWLGLVLGAILGALAYSAFGLGALWVATGALLVIASINPS